MHNPTLSAFIPAVRDLLTTIPTLRAHTHVKLWFRSCFDNISWECYNSKMVIILVMIMCSLKSLSFKLLHDASVSTVLTIL